MTVKGPEETSLWPKNTRQALRRRLVQAVRQGLSQRQAARRFGVSLATVQRWLARAQGRRLDRVDWAGRPRRGRRAEHATDPDLEDRILQLRHDLKEHRDLGEYGAAAIRRTLLQQGLTDVPSERTIGRILARRGALDGDRRRRTPPPPPGWYLPDLASRRVELNSWDAVEGLVIQGGQGVEVLNVVSLHGGLCELWPGPNVTAAGVVEALVEHWRAWGLPGYAQFDNDTCFQWAHQYPDTFGRVTRTCLQLGVVPVFVPPQETGFQAAIESYNGRWQAKVWCRFRHTGLPDVCDRSGRFVQAYRQRTAARREATPPRRSFPADWELDLGRPLSGRVIYLRRTDDAGAVSVLGHRWAVSGTWCHRLVRAEVDLDRGRIRFYALRWRDPKGQPLLKAGPYPVPTKRFHE
jgi:transposase